MEIASELNPGAHYVKKLVRYFESPKIGIPTPTYYITLTLDYVTSKNFLYFSRERLCFLYKPNIKINPVKHTFQVTLNKISWIVIKIK